ncbi:MAG: tetratricopeptide repeat protein [Proteobacteria bacterium]|nr:tetratricopeptide repeat protein [Pseudomonadota bacterium]
MSRIPPTRKAAFHIEWVIVLLICCLEWSLVYLCFHQTVSIRRLLVLHSIIAGCLLLWIWLWFMVGLDIKFPVLITVLTTVMGPFGSLTAAVSILAYGVFARRGTPFLNWLASLFPEEKRSDSIELFQRLSAGWDDFSDKRRIMAFQDVMALGTVLQKREALAKISRYYKREFAPALLKALKDSSNAVRVQAATVVAKIEQDYMSAYLTLFRKRGEIPNDADILLKLAQQTDAYAYCGILDTTREDELRREAVGYYERYLTMRPDDAEVRFSLGRLYIHCCNPEKARHLLKHCVEEDGFDTPSLGLWYMESLYGMSEFHEISTLADNYLSHAENEKRLSLRVLDVLRLWSRGIPEERLRIGAEND